MKTRIVSVMAFQAAFILAVLIWALDLVHRDFNVPINYWGDTVWFTSVVKGMLDNGWVYYNQYLGAPFGFYASSFPSMTHVDWVVMKLISLFVDTPGAVINSFWIVSIVFSSWTAFFAFSCLGIARAPAVLASLIFALLPFALARNTSHISLVYFAIPLISQLAIRLAYEANWTEKNAQYALRLGLFGCLVQGFNTIYFSFFGVFILGAATLIGCRKTNSFGSLKPALIAILILLASTVINLIPSILSQSQEETSVEIWEKQASEAERFGLKIRTMVSPSRYSPIPVLNTWGEENHQANFPLENENRTARLGLITSIGFLLLLLVSLNLVKPEGKHKQKIVGAAALSLAALLLTTIGGFGAIFNLLVVTDIRGFNRFSVFIAFFALAGLLLYVGSLFEQTRSKKIKTSIAVFALCLFLISLIDQISTLTPIQNRAEIDHAAARYEKQTVAQLEDYFSKEVAVYQYPRTDFPRDQSFHRMQVYDHGRPYLWSTQVNWSWPSSTKNHLDWSDSLPKNDYLLQFKALQEAGFSAVWIDVYGYVDSGQELVGLCQSLPGVVEITSGVAQRHRVFDITGFDAQPIE